VKTAVLAFGILVWVSLMSPPARAGAAQPHAFAFVLDHTDPWAPGHIQALAERAGELDAELRGKDCVWVFSLGNDRHAARLAFSRACPKRGVEANLLFEGRDYVEELFRRGFAAPLTAVFDSVVNSAAVSRVSAVAEALSQVTRFSTFARASGARRLVIFSDLVENVREFSFYEQQCLLKPDGTPFLDEWNADLRGVDVEVFVLLRERDTRVQRSKLIEEWRKLLHYWGAKSVTFTKVAE
jgi:hypothetical protein